MSAELEKIFSDLDPEEHEAPEPAVDEPIDMRPDLSELGIIEHERGVCEDTYENRSTLRRAKLQWQPVYDQSGSPTGLIAARSAEAMAERRIQSLAEKRPLLVDPDNRNSDYLTGLDLLLEDKAITIAPPWVIGATKAWQAEQAAGGPPTRRRAPKGLPARCRIMKSDGIRCMLWSSGRPKDDGLCRVHLRHVRKPGEDIERARRKLIQAAPYAVDVLEQLMESAESEPVRLKASTEILDRAGLRGGQDINIDMEVTEGRPAAQVVLERLNRLKEGAASLQMAQELIESTSKDGEIVDAELVEQFEEVKNSEVEDVELTEEEMQENLEVLTVKNEEPEPEEEETDPQPFEDLEAEANS
jgi:hypothetical protein